MTSVTRRQIVQGAGTLGIAAALPAVARAEALLPIQLAAFDSRHAPSRAFATEARRLGLATHDTGGDITALYAERLMRRVGRGPIAIAGLTPMVQLFGLRLMIESPQLRLVFLRQDDGHAFGPHRIRDQMTGQRSAQPAPIAAARIFANWRPDDATVTAGRSDIAAADAHAISGDTLVAWLLAPVARSIIV